MKKVLSLITLLVCTLAATAKDYMGQLIVGSVENSKATATVTQNGDTYTLAAGSYSLTGLTGTTAAGVTTLKQDGTVVARFNASTLYANFTQGGNQVEFTTAGFQLNNRGFEAWHDVSMKVSAFIGGGTYRGEEPNGWHGFLSSTSNGLPTPSITLGPAIKAVAKSLAKTEDKHSGSYAALLTAGSALNITANGTMTTGRMNMGSTIAADTNNHAAINTTDTDANGDPFYTPLNGSPDSISAWVKFVSTTTNAKLSAIALADGAYQDPEADGATYNNVVAKAQDGAITASSAWKQVTVPFDYTKGTTTAAPTQMLITMSTSATPGGGAEGDKLYVDDIYLTYNAGEVTGITCSKFEGFTFDAATTEYDVTYTGSDALTEADINATFANLGKGAITGKSVETTATGYRAVVAIYNQELSKAVEYVINANVPNELYLIGSFNGWDLETAVPFTLAADGKFTLTQQLAATDEVKFLAKKSWSDNDVFGSTDNETHRFAQAEVGQTLNLAHPGSNILMNHAGEWTFTVDKEAMTVVITGSWPDEYSLVGDFNDWNSTADLLTAGTDGKFTITKSFEGNFKFVKNGTDWLGPESALDITADNATGIALSTNSGLNNYNLPAGEWAITLDPAAGTFNVSGEWPAQKLYVAGNLNGWNTSGDYEMALADGKYTYGPVELAAGGFKIVTDVADAWNNTYYGPANDKTMTLGTAEALVENGGGNYLIAEAGTYTITVDLTAMTVTLTGTPAPVELTGVAFSEANHYATWYGDKDLALPEPLKAYVVTAINADEATITQVDYIPAGVAVLLQNDGTGSGYSAPRYIGATQTVTSLLAGSNEATTVSEGYVLFNDEFVMSDSGTLAAHRCYLPAANAAGAPARLRIGKGGGVVTAIDNVNAARVAGVKYVSLDGRVSDKPFTGVNVVVKTMTDGTTNVSKVVK
ncbi:MAG: SusF/SusE family outer membrane protein [Muribaculaceae bacterium]|nr:SusF/SusE family outer membrane protein [Muribaculaceae bacterium]